MLYSLINSLKRSAVQDRVRRLFVCAYGASNLLVELIMQLCLNSTLLLPSRLAAILLFVLLGHLILMASPLHVSVTTPIGTDSVNAHETCEYHGECITTMPSNQDVAQIGDCTLTLALCVTRYPDIFYSMALLISVQMNFTSSYSPPRSAFITPKPANTQAMLQVFRN